MFGQAGTQTLNYYELCKIPMQSEQNGPARLPDGGLNDGTTNNSIMAQQSFDTKEIHFIHHLIEQITYPERQQVTESQIFGKI